MGISKGTFSTSEVRMQFPNAASNRAKIFKFLNLEISETGSWNREKTRNFNEKIREVVFLSNQIAVFIERWRCQQSMEQMFFGDFYEIEII